MIHPAQKTLPQAPLPTAPPLERILPRHRASLHLATTLSALLSLPSVWPSLKGASGSSSHAYLPRLKELSAAHADLTPYLTREMLLRSRSFMQGIAFYRDHPAHRGEETAKVVWRSGTTSVRDYAPNAPPDAPVVFVVPSLINRFTILDLEPKQSFLRFFAAQGLHPYVVDWDAPGESEKTFTLGDYVIKRLVPALRALSPDKSAHIVGYCMGGALTLALAVLFPDLARTITLLATPWDFHAGFEAMGQDGKSLESRLRIFLEKNDFFPVEVVQSVFTAFQPLHAFQKFSAFSRMDQESPEAARFVLTEDWLNDGVPLTISAARECYGDWSARNALAKKEWLVNGRAIDPVQAAIPAYVVIPGKDRIVPPQSALPLVHALPNAVCFEPMMGHIGIMSSPQARAQIWTPLAAWINAH